ncbi:hypothetical protein BJY01DRAFT_246516 [Aspergillus pseudoustus]|uniref:Rhodopsin domain-containing protein n=1 Tax=Aspergillus pseudoustus TaxID=1810923 RepID=A0ABR4K6W1_9EURO
MWDIRAVNLIDPSSTQVLSAASITFCWATCFAKISILLLYKRIFPFCRERIAAWICIVADVVLYTACIGVAIGSLVECAELDRINDSYCRYNSGGQLVFSSMVNVVTDLYLLILPIPRLLNLQVNRGKKIGLLVTFPVDFASLARLVNVSIYYQSSDVLWVSGHNAQFTIAEINIAIIVACATSFPVFFTRVHSLASSNYHPNVSLLPTTRPCSDSDSCGSKVTGSNNGPDIVM